MWHSDIRRPMNIYGDAESGDMRRVNGKIAVAGFQFAVNGTENSTEGL